MIQNYFGEIVNMYELNFYGICKVILFQCKWVDIKSPRGFKVDKYGFLLLNFSNLSHTGEYLKDDPFGAIISSETSILCGRSKGQ